MVAEEMPPPMSEEFTVASGEIRLGLPAAAALARMSGRVRSADWDLVVTAVTTQLQTGGNLAEILERITGTIRERVRVQGEVTSLTAEGRLSALILVLLPPVLALLLLLHDPRYFQPLVADPLGRLLIAGAVVGQGIGALVVRGMLTLDV
jgi:tight adherence protein B